MLTLSTYIPANLRFPVTCCFCVIIISLGLFSIMFSFGYQFQLNVFPNNPPNVFQFLALRDAQTMHFPSLMCNWQKESYSVKSGLTTQQIGMAYETSFLLSLGAICFWLVICQEINRRYSKNILWETFIPNSYKKTQNHHNLLWILQWLQGWKNISS